MSMQVRTEPKARRELILDEMLRIVGERGYRGFGIQELAERCGLTKPGLLHHFGSKDQLLLALLNEIDAKEEAEVAGLFAEELRAATTPEDVRAIFRRALRIIAERGVARPDLLQLRVVLRAEALDPAHPAHRYFAEQHTARLERMTRGAALFSPAPASIARQILATLNGLEEQWLREGAGFDFLAEWQEFVDRIVP